MRLPLFLIRCTTELLLRFDLHLQHQKAGSPARTQLDELGASDATFPAFTCVRSGQKKLQTLQQLTW